jgi:hypothetical protein
MTWHNEETKISPVLGLVKIKMEQRLPGAQLYRRLARLQLVALPRWD